MPQTAKVTKRAKFALKHLVVVAVSRPGFFEVSVGKIPNDLRVDLRAGTWEDAYHYAHSVREIGRCASLSRDDFLSGINPPVIFGVYDRRRRTHLDAMVSNIAATVKQMNEPLVPSDPDDRY